jgi:hypothetical protein
MYKDIKLSKTTGSVYVAQLDRLVGATEIVVALTLANPTLIIKDTGILASTITLEPDSMVIIVTSAYNSVARIEEVSRLYPGVTIRILEAFSAYSDEYEAKVKNRKELVNAGFDYENKTFQIDDGSRTSISGKVLYLQVNTQVDTVYWKATDNNIVTFTRAEFFVFASAVSDYYENLILTT